MAETADRSTAQYTWIIENFTRLNCRKIYSEMFYVGGYKWRMLLYPNGNNVDHLSLYLDVVDSATLPYGWSRHAQFSLALVNQVRKSKKLEKETQHAFNAQEGDWGFTSFIHLSELHNPARGYLVNDTIRIEATVTVERSRDPNEETSVGGPENPKAEQNNNSGNTQEDVTISSPQQPTLCTQSPCLNTPRQDPIDATEVNNQAADNTGASNIASSVDEAPPGKIGFLSYWVSSEASFVLEKIHGLHKDTFAKFSMKGQSLQTVLLESFASFIKSMSAMKVNEVNEGAMSVAAISIEDFEQVGLDLSWLKQRLDEAKSVNKHSESLVYVDLCESALRVARAKVCELEEGLARAKTEAEDRWRNLPKSVGAGDHLLKEIL